MTEQENDAAYQLALSNCAREPVHIPGRVQSFGAIIGFNTETGVIEYVSDNLHSVTGLGAEDDPFDLLDKPFWEVTSNREVVHELRGALSVSTIQVQRERLGSFSLNESGRIDLSVHKTGPIATVELERDDYPPQRSSSAISQVRAMLSQLSHVTDINNLLDSAVELLYRTTGYNRVMAYRFLANGDGEVVSEKCGGFDPFLGLRYPASDIPQQVRNAMLVMPFRCIADINASESELLCQSESSPLDLTLTHLKGVSPLHIEYLRNMGVRATMNIPIIVRGELWGLFSLHHKRPRLLSPDQRNVCELFGHFASLEMQQRLDTEAISKRKKTQSLHQYIQANRLLAKDIGSSLEAISSDLLKLFDADGMAMLHGGRMTSFGMVPSHGELQRFVENCENEITTLDTVSPWFNELSENTREGNAEDQPLKIAGALISVLNREGNLAIAFFRQEEINNIRWAGHPEKRIEFGPHGPRLHPRASFDEYVETVKDRSRPWKPSEISAISELRAVILDVLYREIKVSSYQWRKQKELQDLLIAELNHRVKNILALVRSIARQTQTNSRSLEEYISSFESRIAALASAHDLIGGNGVRWASMESLLRIEFLPYMSQNQHIEILGPGVDLKSDVAPIMALVVHELLTNAAKHGALHDETGQLNVGWRMLSGGLEFNWSERVDKQVAPPAAMGFGLSLLRRAVPHECGGEATIDFRCNGLDARIWLPSTVVNFSESPVTIERKVNFGKTEQQINARSGLIIEDNLIILMEMETTLREAGCHRIVSASNAADAYECLSEQSFDFAVLDINLSGENSFKIAEAIAVSGTAIVFVTGYGESYPLPDHLEHCQRLSKPVRRDDLVNAINEATAASGLNGTQGNQG